MATDLKLGKIMTAAVAAFVLCSGTAAAQQPASQQQAAYAPEEIIVTARRRQESIMKTPVTMSVLTARQIEDLRLTSVRDLSQVMPGFNVTDGFGGVGAIVFLRGVGNGDSAQFIDQSVQLNVDGATLSQGLFYRMGLFDVAQVEVLKGPQGLFYGKSSSAGIIAVHTADPTDTWQTKATVGYEFKADEIALDGYVSGPLTDKLGLRIAGYFGTMKGWMKNGNPNDHRDRLPIQDEYGGRLTLKYDDPDTGLRANLKIFASHVDSNWWAADRAQNSCALGDRPTRAEYVPFDNCVLDDVNQGGLLGLPYIPGDYSIGSPLFATGSPDPVFRDGVPYTFVNAWGATLNLDYDITKALSLSSVTAMTATRSGEVGITAPSSPGFFVGLSNKNQQRVFSQELRLTSDYEDSWINFMVGGVYTKSSQRQDGILLLPTFTLYNGQKIKLQARSWSGFAQVLLTPIDKWELSAGVRHTYDKKYFKSIIISGNYVPTSDAVQNLPRTSTYYDESNTSPEVTLTYRPTDDLTAFASYKHGYKGPGFNLSTTSTVLTPDSGINPFGGEKVRGGEIGIKASLLDRSLTLTATAYHYKYIDQQVSFVDNTTLVAVIQNGDNMKLDGIELGLTYRVPNIEGLTLNAFVNYNRAEFTHFPRAPCYGNQPVGCVNGAQDLKGRTPFRAPRWVAQWGANYRTDVSEDYQIEFSTNWNHTSSYYVAPELGPTSFQDAHLNIDASVRFGKIDGSWEIAVLGRNLSNAHYTMGGLDVGAVSPGVIGDSYFYVVRPRQVMLQLTVRPDVL